MKVIVGLILIVVVFTGCARIKGLGIDYTRWGDQKIEGFEYIQTLPDGTVNMVKFNQQQGGDAMAQIVKMLTDKIPVPPIVPIP
jgi:hypothetical protein